MILAPVDLLDAGGIGLAACRLPEHRQIDLYDRRRKLGFHEAAEAPAAQRAAAARLLLARRAHAALESQLLAADPLLGEGRGSWQRYQDLPRTSAVDKMVAEVYRLLRIVHIATAHSQGHAEWHDGLVRLACTFGRCALSLTLTEAGLELLASFVAAYLVHQDSPYPSAYVEWLLSQYFTDLVGEVRKFADEDRILYQFQPRPFFNRHFRYDCENPRLQLDQAHCRIEIPRAHAQAVLFPIDFFAFIDDRLHIVPVEALDAEGRLSSGQLVRWASRCPDGRLPAAMRGRFVRERMIAGLPMT